MNLPNSYILQHNQFKHKLKKKNEPSDKEPKDIQIEQEKRNEKKELTFRLKKNLNEINILVSGLQKELPASKLSNFEKKPKEEPKLILEKTKPSKLDELEKELENIESRLKKLA